MSITIELAPEIEQIVRAKAEARGIAVEEYLPVLMARAMQQEELEALPAQPVASWDSAIRRIWDTPEEDAAWAYLSEL